MRRWSLYSAIGLALIVTNSRLKLRGQSDSPLALNRIAAELGASR